MEKFFVDPEDEFDTNVGNEEDDDLLADDLDDEDFDLDVDDDLDEDDEE